MSLNTGPPRTPTCSWHRNPWLIDHGAALYVQHTWREPAAHARRGFAQAKDHILLPVASSVADADALDWPTGFDRPSRRPSGGGPGRLAERAPRRLRGLPADAPRGAPSVHRRGRACPHGRSTRSRRPRADRGAQGPPVRGDPRRAQGERGEGFNCQSSCSAGRCGSWPRAWTRSWCAARPACTRSTPTTCRHLELIPRLCAGDPTVGPLAALTQPERFHWLVAPASTVVQPAEVHTRHDRDPGGDARSAVRDVRGAPWFPHANPRYLTHHVRHALGCARCARPASSRCCCCSSPGAARPRLQLAEEPEGVGAHDLTATWRLHFKHRKTRAF